MANVTTAKQDLAVYKNIKKNKSDFNSEYKKIGLNVNKQNFPEAKKNIATCEGYITEIEKLVDNIPNSSSYDTAKNLVVALIGFLTMIAAAPCYHFVKKTERNFNEEKLKRIKEKRDKQDIKSRASFDIWAKTDKASRDDKINEVERESLVKLSEKYLDEFKKQRAKKEELDKKHNKTLYNNLDRDFINKSNEERNISNIEITAASGSFLALISMKPLKAKAKNVLKNCRNKLDKTKAYIDKVERMSNAVKESFDETLDSLYEAFTEGAIDEFEYDTLVDHLLD